MRFRYVNRDHNRYRIMTNDKGVFHGVQQYDFVLCQWMAVDEETARSIRDPEFKEVADEPQPTVV